MKDLGVAKKILGMEITRDRSVGKLFLSPQAYVEKVLKRFNMNNAKPMTAPFAAHFKLSADISLKTDEEMEHMSSVPYLSAVGSIIYTMVCTQLDISHVFIVMSRYITCPRAKHWAKMSNSVIGYVDSDFTGDLDKRRSLTGYLFTLSRSAISWKATLQAIVTLSIIEAEYMALVEAHEDEALEKMAKNTHLWSSPKGPTLTQKRQAAGMYDLDPFNMINAKFDALTNVLAKKMEDLSMLVSSSSSSGSSQQVAHAEGTTSCEVDYGEQAAYVVNANTQWLSAHAMISKGQISKL
ncbi:hypothetical protein GH714_029104 [Hevea brasiliensis]|uniref:Reverse transcriptase Ty1/copia-type domain-containing protein n=1 Tax=Hevea brasiliensis TaxID=3981 RepID=A0A6A6LH35_HEVBR|nr:hypothetical protein GH714_029104 [Hevea brasiliensis]